MSFVSPFQMAATVSHRVRPLFDFKKGIIQTVSVQAVVFYTRCCVCRRLKYYLYMWSRVWWLQVVARSAKLNIGLLGTDKETQVKFNIEVTNSYGALSDYEILSQDAHDKTGNVKKNNSIKH